MTAACGGLLWKRGADTTFGFQTKPKKTQTKIITVGGGGFNQPEPETGTPSTRSEAQRSWLQ